jgi:hypothetical protein
MSSSRSGRPPRLSQNRTCAVHIRLFGAANLPLAGSHRGRPVHGPSVPTSREACYPPFPHSAPGVVRKRWVFMPRALGLGKSRETMTSRLPVGCDRSRSTSSATSRGSLRPCCTEPSSFQPPPSPPALSLPSVVTLGVKAAFRLLSGYCAPVLDLPGHRVSFLRCTAYRLGGTRQISTGKIQQTSRPSRPHYACISDEYRASPLPADLPDAGALRSFAFARDGRAPMTSTRPPLAGSPGLRHWKGPGIPDQRPCLLGVGFPSSGPRAWTFTSCLLVMPFAPGFAADRRLTREHTPRGASLSLGTALHPRLPSDPPSRNGFAFGSSRNRRQNHGPVLRTSAPVSSV